MFAGEVSSLLVEHWTHLADGESLNKAIRHN